MPVGAYRVMKTTLERVEADVQSMLGLRYKAWIALHNMTRWMQFALEWMGTTRGRNGTGTAKRQKA